ncbi:MAG: (2Fe-2S)-binding protein [Deltaproteobacteria bacterium]|nr:(2Fe-2S)-binding protein [Deltaproteobacteria bacterium]
MSTVSISVDGRTIQARSDERLLWALLDAGIFVPSLCAIRGLDPPPGGCRLCFVEVEGQAKPVTSCTQPVFEGMRVRTRSPAVDRLVRSAFENLLSVHRLDCKDCPAGKPPGRCALVEIAKKRKIPLRVKRLPKIEPDLPIDESRAELTLDPNHCVLCGQCVHVCRNEVGKDILCLAHRGLDMRVSTFDGRPLAEQGCGACVRCAEVCPVGAIYLRRT